jgi:hypothetical protein
VTRSPEMSAKHTAELKAQSLATRKAWKARERRRKARRKREARWKARRIRLETRDERRKAASRLRSQRYRDRKKLLTPKEGV